MLTSHAYVRVLLLVDEQVDGFSALFFARLYMWGVVRVRNTAFGTLVDVEMMILILAWFKGHRSHLHRCPQMI